MKYTAVMFDLDGTLLDTLEDLADSMNRVLKLQGLPTHPTEAYRYFVGSGATALVTRALPQQKNRTDELVAECTRAFREEYERRWNLKTRPYPGVSDLLKRLAEAGLLMAVLTNKPQDFAELCVKEYFDGVAFSAVRGQRDGFPAKPDPAGPLVIAQEMSVPAGRFAYLGDSDVDMMTAVNAGMYPVGAAWGFRTEDELRRAGAETIIRRPEELVGLLQ